MALFITDNGTFVNFIYKNIGWTQGAEVCALFLEQFQKLYRCWDCCRNISPEDPLTVSVSQIQQYKTSWRDGSRKTESKKNFCYRQVLTRATRKNFLHFQPLELVISCIWKNTAIRESPVNGCSSLAREVLNGVNLALKETPATKVTFLSSFFIRRI